MMILHKKAEAVFVICLALICSVYGTCSDSNSVCTPDQCCYIDLPGVNGDGGGSYPVQDCYNDGDGVIMNCTGTLNGPPFNDCLGGNWQFPFPSTCEPVAGCPRPTITDNQLTLTPDESETPLYSRVYYSCVEGYSLVGPSSTVCESGGVWNPTTIPSCQAECLLPSLVNGYVTPNQTTYENGEVLTYSCNVNYTLVGISTTTCRDGVYDPPNKPTCYGKCLPPLVASSDYSVQRDPVDHASTITINCNTGYSTGTGTDQDMTCTDGVFDVDSPTCYQNCPILSSSFNNGVRSGDTSPYYHDETVSYTCNTGYTLEGSSNITCGSGAWSDSEPVCRANCQVGSVPNSDYTSGGSIAHSTTFNITCATNYSTGSSLTTEFSCNDGTLSPADLPTCYADCKPPIVPYSDYRTQQLDVFHTTVFEISCWSNYSIDADSQSAQLTCNDGSFGGDTVMCYENCPEISAPDNGLISQGDSPFFHEEVVTFQCDANFTLVGSSDITCGDGDWSDVPPECSAQCKRPVIPNSDANSATPLLDHDEAITVTCEHRYSNGESRTATSNCTDGQLDPSVPFCYSDCTPPIVANSNYDMQKDDVFHSTTITITCGPGYSTGSSLNTTLTCNEGDFGDVPTCYADCTPPVVPYSDYRIQQPDVLHSSDFIISCWSNYSTGPDSKETTLSCNNGTLSGDDVTCYGNCEVPLVDDSDFSQPKDDVFHSVQFNVTCDEGFSNGDAVYTTRTCDNGVLTGDDSTCYANCPDFGSIEDGTYTGDFPPFYHEESVTISCDTNYTLVGEITLTCSDGNWSHAIPTCEADCLPPVIANSDYSTSMPQVSHDTFIVITCNSGYSTGSDVTQNTTCDDGTFVPDPKDCLRDCTPPIVENSDYASQQDPVYTSVSFDITCDTNYTVGNADPTATTTLTCQDGQLDKQNVTCYRNCPDPGEPADGQYEPEGDGFYHGTVVYYYCDDRFDLFGASEISCFDGEWSDVAPNCTDKSSFDLIMLTCGPTSMEVQIPTILLEDIEVNDIGMEGELSCGGYIEGDMMFVNTSLSGCRTNKTENATHDVYTNRVVNNYYNDVITRVVDVQIPMKCVYARNQQVRAVRYAVLDYVIGKNLEETGTYKMSFGIYNTSMFTHRYADGTAVDIDINRELFFQLELVTDVDDNKLVAQDCYATPSEDSGDSVSHDLIKDGCTVDHTLAFISGNGDDVKVQFKLNAFRFVNDADKQAYVHCMVFVCHAASNDELCGLSCGSSSKSRRDTQDALSPYERAKRKAVPYIKMQEQVNDESLDGDDVDEVDRTKRASNHAPVVKYVHAGPIRWSLGGGEPQQVFGKPSNSEIHGDQPFAAQPNDVFIADDSSSSMTAWMHSVIGMGVIIAVFSVLLMFVVRHYRRRLKRDYRYQPVASCS